ncbi:MAG: hypothetical protein ACLSHC_16725 [Bilophila wadsworthia]
MSLFSLEWWQIALLFLPALLNLWGIWHAFNHTLETPLERVLWMVACVLFRPRRRGLYAVWLAACS